MAVFAINYRIHPDETAEERRANLLAAVEREASGRAVWDETGACAIIESIKSADYLANALVSGAKGDLPIFDRDKDLLLVVDLSWSGDAPSSRPAGAVKGAFQNLSKLKSLIRKR